MSFTIRHETLPRPIAAVLTFVAQRTGRTWFVYREDGHRRLFFGRLR